jgi:hypothetical protein
MQHVLETEELIIRKPEMNILFGRPRHKRENIKMDIK